MATKQPPDIFEKAGFLMDTSTIIRPKLKHSSVFLQTEEGVFCQSDKATFLLKGKSIARWVSTLGPYMNGEHTLDELCAEFEPAQREMFTRLVQTLLERGVLKNGVLEAHDILPDSVRHQFASQIDYIDHFTDQPLEKFKTFRESRILLIGSGESLIALALSLLRNGLQELFLAPVDSSDRYLQSLEPEAARVRQGGSDLRLSLSNLSSQHEFENFEGYDIVVYCSDSTSLQEIARLSWQCVLAGRPFLPATIFAGQAVIGPFTRSQEDPCWLCAQLRLSAYREESKSVAFWKELALGDDPSSTKGNLFDPIARRIGHGLGFELFKILSGTLPSETEHGVIVQDLENIEAYSSQLVHHPLCPVCTHNDPDIAVQRLLEIMHGKRDRELTEDEIYTKYNRLLDPHVGAFRDFDDDQLQQIPLKGSRITMGQPGSPLIKSLSVTSYSTTNVMSAHTLAFKEAIKMYTRALPDARGMLSLSAQEMNARGYTMVQTQQLATWSGGLSFKTGVPIEWLPAYSLLKQAVVYVPAAAVYPHTPLNRLGIFQRTSAGTTVSPTLRTALTNGLLSALGHMHIQELIRGRAAVAPLAIDAISSASTDLAYLVKSAQRFERPFACLEVIHSSPLSVVVVRTTDTSSEQLVTYGVGFSGPEATTMALLDFVSRLQSGNSLSGTTDELCSGLIQESDQAYVSPAASRFTSPATNIHQIENYLRERETDTLFVNITTSDIWDAEALISGIVFLTSW